MNAAACKHFTGVQHAACGAGVDYAAVTDSTQTEVGQSLPCLNRGVPCASRAFPTSEELAAEKAAWAESFRRAAVARAAIAAKHGKSRDLVGEMACPVCATGTLHYSIASRNGHIHAACSTDGCARWME